LAFLFRLNSHYFSTCPRVPLDNNGTFVYLNETENSKMLAAKTLFGGTWLGAGGFYIVNWALKKLKVR
jgi:hypothetical protein